jgi:hypothetical protein
LVKSAFLRGLVFQRCRVENTVLLALARALQAGIQLEQLEISHAPLPDAVVEPLAVGLDVGRSLISLRLLNARVTDAALKRLAPALSVCPLTEVNLMRNAITHVGVGELSQALSGAGKIRSLGAARRACNALSLSLPFDLISATPSRHNAPCAPLHARAGGDLPSYWLRVQI